MICDLGKLLHVPAAGKMWRHVHEEQAVLEGVQCEVLFKSWHYVICDLGKPLHCYTCDSLLQAKCGDTFMKNRQFLKECSARSYVPEVTRYHWEEHPLVDTGEEHTEKDDDVEKDYAKSDTSEKNVAASTETTQMDTVEMQTEPAYRVDITLQIKFYCFKKIHSYDDKGKWQCSFY